MTTSIVSDERSCRTSLRRKSSSTIGSINTLFRRHFVVFGISTFESYSQRFFHFEFAIFRDLLAFKTRQSYPPCLFLPVHKVARFPSWKPISSPGLLLYEFQNGGLSSPLSACKAVKLKRGVIFQDPMENFAFLNQKRVSGCVIFHSVLRSQLNFVGSPGVFCSRKPCRTSLDCFCFQTESVQVCNFCRLLLHRSRYVKLSLIGERFVN